MGSGGWVRRNRAPALQHVAPALLARPSCWRDSTFLGMDAGGTDRKGRHVHSWRLSVPGQTGFLAMPLLDRSLFTSGDNSFDFFVSLHKEGLCWHVQPLVQGPCWHVQPLVQGPSFLTKETD